MPAPERLGFVDIAPDGAKILTTHSAVRLVTTPRAAENNYKMKSSVSFETAVALKDAGFPKPDMVYWNYVWFDKSGEQWRPGSLTLNPDIFAPSAPYILHQLFPEGKIRIQVGAEDILRMALDPEVAAQAWMEHRRN